MYLWQPYSKTHFKHKNASCTKILLIIFPVLAVARDNGHVSLVSVEKGGVLHTVRAGAPVTSLHWMLQDEKWYGCQTFLYTSPFCFSALILCYAIHVQYLFSFISSSLPSFSLPLSILFFLIFPSFFLPLLLPFLSRSLDLFVPSSHSLILHSGD